SHPEAERRFGNPGAVDGVARAIARGIESYLRRAYTYGGVTSGALATLDLTDFPTSDVFDVIPDAQAPSVPRQIRQSDYDALQQGWDRMMQGKGLRVDSLAADFRVLL